MTENSTFDLTILAPEREVTVVEEEHHQLVLARYAPSPTGPPNRVIAELAFAPIARGAYAGRHGVEVRLDGQRVGELTFRMAQRYIPVIDTMISRGGRPGASAIVKNGRRGLIEVELRMPEERHAPVPIPIPDDGSSGRHGAAGGPGCGDRRSPLRRGLWIGAGVVGLLAVIGIANRGSDPAPIAPTAASPATYTAPTSTAPTFTAPTSTAPAFTAPAVAPPTQERSVPIGDPDPRPTQRAALPVAEPDDSQDSAPAAFYKNCAAAKAAGAAPLHRGEPGYSSKLDGDNDGVACE